MPGARLALTLLIGINLFNYIDRQVLSAVVTKIRDDAELMRGESWAKSLVAWFQSFLGFEPENAMVGSLALAFMASYMLLAPVFGLLAERHRRWVLVGIGVILWSLASGASGLATTFGILFLTRCCVGLGEAAYGPVAPAMISDLYPVKDRGRVLAWFYVAIPVGSALGYVLGGAIAGWFNDWRYPFYAVVPPGLLLGILCFFMPEPPRGRVDLAEGAVLGETRWRDRLQLLKTPSYLMCSLGMTAAFFAIGGIAFWMPTYLYEKQETLGIEQDLAHVNLVFGVIVVISGLAATLLGGMAGDRLRNRFPGSYFLVSGAGMLVGLPFFFAALYATSFTWIWVFIFLAVFCLFLNTGPTNAILANVTHPAVRASGFALNIFIIHAFGDAVSPLIIGGVADWYAVDGKPDLQTGFMLVSGMIFLSGSIWLAGAPYLARDTALAPGRLAEPLSK